MDDKKTLSEKDLVKVTGGDLIGSSDTYFHGTYLCPICNCTHELVTKNGPVYGYNCVVDKTTACAGTFNVVMNEFTLGYPDGSIVVIPESNPTQSFIVAYKFDYIMAQGNMVVPTGW